MKNNFTSSVERASPNLRRNFVMPTRDFDTFSLGKAKNKKPKNLDKKKNKCHKFQ